MASRRRIKLAFSVSLEPPYYVAECKQLGVASSGDTEAEALANITEAVLLYLDTLEDYGECAEVLRRAGVPILCDPIVICPPGGVAYTAMVDLPVSASGALA